MESRPLVAALVAALLSILGSGFASADEVRYFQKDGVTYCETRRIVQERIPQSRMEERMETVYREKLTTEMRETTRLFRTPVTEYRWEAFWVRSWNPLARPYVAYRYVPRTHWETRNEVVKVPVTARRVVPETVTVRRPIAGWRSVEREVVSCVPVGSSAVAVGGGLPAPPLTPIEPPALARQGTIGGISRLGLDDHPPRYGNGIAWRASSDAIGR